MVVLDLLTVCRAPAAIEGTDGYGHGPQATGHRHNLGFATPLHQFASLGLIQHMHIQCLCCEKTKQDKTGAERMVRRGGGA